QQELQNQIAELVRKAASLSAVERVQQLEQERDDLRRQVKELQDERERLRQLLARTEKERDGYLRTVYAYLQKELPKDEHWEIPPRDKQLLLADVISELEQLNNGQ